MTDPAVNYVGTVLTVADQRKLVGALRRARSLLVDLEHERDSRAIERVRHGAMHEIETCMTVLREPVLFGGARQPEEVQTGEQK